MGGWDPSLRDARFMLDIDGRFFDARALAQQFKRTGEIRIPGRGLDQDIQLKKNAINRVMVATGKTGRQEGMYLGHHHPSFGQYASYRQAKRRFSREKQQGLPARFVNVGREEDRLIDAVVALAKNRGGVVPQNAQALARELISRYESTYQRPFPFPIGISLSDNFGTPASSVNPTTTQPTKRERASPAPTSRATPGGIAVVDASHRFTHKTKKEEAVPKPRVTTSGKVATRGAPAGHAKNYAESVAEGLDGRYYVSKRISTGTYRWKPLSKAELAAAGLPQ